MNTKEALAIMEQIQAFLQQHVNKDADFIHAMEYTRDNLESCYQEEKEAYAHLVVEMRKMFAAVESIRA